MKSKVFTYVRLYDLLRNEILLAFSIYILNLSYYTNTKKTIWQKSCDKIIAYILLGVPIAKQ